MVKQSYKKHLLLIVMVMISVLSFSVMSIPAYAEKGGMVSDTFDKNAEEKTTDETETTDAIDATDSGDSTPPIEEEQSENTVSTGMTMWDYIKVVLALIFVVVLLFFVLKLVNRNNKNYQSNQMLQNLGGISVGQQKSVQLLKVGNSLFLVGVGTDIHIIKEITDEQEQKALLKMHEEKQELAVQMPHIVELFNNLKDKVIKKPAEQEGKENFKQTLDEKLKQIKKSRKQQLDELKQKENDNG